LGWETAVGETKRLAAASLGLLLGLSIVAEPLFPGLMADHDRDHDHDAGHGHSHDHDAEDQAEDEDVGTNG
jgi:ABC-type Zn2+ transport system substrate-binding protein/surface adhesin